MTSVSKKKYLRSKPGREAKARGSRRLMLKKYGLTEADYTHLLIAQGGACFLCLNRRSQFGRLLVVDHDHRTGRVRGLLCHIHNRALGVLGDDVVGLVRAIRYIQGSIKGVGA